MNKHEEHIEYIFKRVKDADAQADLIIHENEQLTIKAQEGRVDQQQVSQTSVMDLRVIKEGKVGLAYSETTEKAALDFMIEQALINSRYASDEDEQNITDQVPSLTTADPALCPEDDVSIETKIDAFIKASQYLLEQEVIESIPYNGYSDAIYSKTIHNSYGLRSSAKHRRVNTYFYPLAKQGSNSAMAMGVQTARCFEDINFHCAADIAHANASALLSGKPIKTGLYDVIFKIDVLENILSVFRLCWSGKAAKQGVNPWRDKIGQLVGSELLTIKDQVTDKQGLGYSLFDDEGFECQDTTLIDQGQLTTLIHNSATAKYFKQKTTGHAYRPSKSPLDVCPHQLVIEPGSTPMKELHNEPYLNITSIEGLGSGSNALTGDFSFGASGFLMANGERQQAIKGITLAGNFFDLLNKISMIGTTNQWTMQLTAKLPSIRFKDLAIAGC